jgi:hypothetical protein
VGLSVQNDGSSQRVFEAEEATFGGLQVGVVDAEVERLSLRVH